MLSELEKILDLSVLTINPHVKVGNEFHKSCFLCKGRRKMMKGDGQ